MMCCALWLFSVGKIRAIFCNIFYMSCTLFYEKTYNFQRLKCLPLGRCNFRSPFLSQLTQRIRIQILGQKSWWMWAFACRGLETTWMSKWRRQGENLKIHRKSFKTFYLQHAFRGLHRSKCRFGGTWQDHQQALCLQGVEEGNARTKGADWGHRGACVTGSPTRSSSWNPDHVRSSSLSVVFAADPDAIHLLGENPAKLESGPALQGSQRPSSPVIHGSREERHATASGHVHPLEGWKPVAGVAVRQADDLPNRYDVTIVVAVGYGATAS